jgi:hypothetical protein
VDRDLDVDRVAAPHGDAAHPVDALLTARQCRSAALLALLALGWIAVCAILGAIMVTA